MPKLTGKQRKFFESWLSNGRNGAAAYRAAYNPKASVARAREEACRLLKSKTLAPLVAEAEAKAKAKTEAAVDRYAATQERIVAELARPAFANMLDYIRVQDDGSAVVDLSQLTRDQAAAIAEVSVEEYLEGRGDDARDVKRVRLKLVDKRGALKDLAHVQGFIVDRKELTGAGGGPIKTEQTVVHDLSGLSDEELEQLARLTAKAAARRDPA